MKSTSMFSAAMAWLALTASAAVAQTMEQPASYVEPASYGESGSGAMTAAYEEPTQRTGPMVQLASWWNNTAGGASANCTDAAPSCGDVLGYGPASEYCGEMCNPRCRSLDLWGNVEFLMWWGKGTDLPPLVGTSTDSATPRGDAAVLGRPNYENLFGGDTYGNELQVGGRFTAGLWLDPHHTLGWGTRFMALGGDDANFAAASTGDQGSQILGRPFFNALLATEDSLLIAYFDELQGDPIAGGSVNASFSNSFLSAETFFRVMMENDGRRRVDLLAGYQMLRLDDAFQVNSFHTSRDPLSLIPVGTTFDITDRIRAKNEFHGGMFGLQSSLQNGQWSIDSIAKMSVGNMNQKIEMFGQTLVDGVAAPGGGLLVQPTNATPPTRERDKWAFIPEISLALAYHPTQNLSFSVGYNIIWMSDVVTSGDQVDRNVNITQVNGPLIGPAVPAPRFVDSDYWLQGINFSMNYDF